MNSKFTSCHAFKGSILTYHNSNIKLRGIDDVEISMR